MGELQQTLQMLELKLQAQPSLVRMLQCVVLKVQIVLHIGQLQDRSQISQTILGLLRILFSL